jgi:uncharacterized protein
MSVNVELIFALILTGLLVSFLCSMVGLGGGVLFIPILILLYEIPADKAVGTSIFCMAMVTLSATIGYARKKKVDWKLGLAYDIFDIPGIILGAYLTTVIHPTTLNIICGIAICIVALLVIFKKSVDHGETTCTLDSANDGDPEFISETDQEKIDAMKNFDYSSTWKGKNIKWVVISSFLGGLVTGMVGLGGGTVDTTTMIILGVPTPMAIGSSEFAMLLTNIVGFTSHAMLGNVIWAFALPMGLAAFVGAQLGCKASSKVNAKVLKKLLGGIALFTGIRLLIGMV